MSEFTIRVTDLDAGGKEYRFPVRPAWIRGALEGHEATAGKRDGALEVRASKSGHDVVVHGTLDAELEVPCARCLEPFALAVHSDVSVLYVPAARLRAESQGKGGEERVDEGEADALPFDGETVVLDDLVRDELVLEVPMIPLCSEACPGISPPPGKQDEADPSEGKVDPRLAPLLRFKDKDKKE
ncbi:MAG: DUF177 domain-containing protein [Labilithrix sp.]|nr:DUF177 domain-containing protein [Labilithrix sp.]